MTDLAIRVENLSKLYHIGQAQKRHDTLRDAISDFRFSTFDWGARLLTRKSGIANRKSDDSIWALKDVSFEVKRGEVVGIIGRNGAGKSTLLKILSRITEPTNGRAVINGRVGSLLEVGTGFHPELTGRENIYLNGAILGMKRAEISCKFDEIVAFAEIEKFLDTPVKHYSSGMYVRLAFAVAAHLEPEILLVDEVLAVGDAAFQKRCLGKMGDVAREGRTVLFVSHNMAAVLNLCPRAILVEAGEIVMTGNAYNVVNDYLNQGVSLGGEVLITADQGVTSNDFRFRSIRVLRPGHGTSDRIPLTEGVDLELEYEIAVPIRGSNVAFHLWNTQGVCVLSSTDVDETLAIADVRMPGRYVARCHVAQNYLRPGRYQVAASSSVPNIRLLADLPPVLAFDVIDTGSVESKIVQGRQGVIAPVLNWVTRELSVK